LLVDSQPVDITDPNPRSLADPTPSLVDRKRSRNDHTSVPFERAPYLFLEGYESAVT